MDMVYCIDRDCLFFRGRDPFDILEEYMDYYVDMMICVRFHVSIERVGDCGDRRYRPMSSRFKFGPIQGFREYAFSRYGILV